MRSLFLSPHNDDETLFGAYTIMRERPLVAVVFDSYVQANRGTGVTAEQRRIETVAALDILGADVRFLGFRDDAQPVGLETALRALGAFDMVYAPAVERDVHAQHSDVGVAAAKVFPKVTYYLTYTRSGGKSRSENEVLPRSGNQIASKLRALACYTSQLQMDPQLNCWPHFTRDLSEYYL